MNKTLQSLFLIIAILASSLLSAQTVLPTDPAVRIGKLDNGLTYYIRHNEVPKCQADFYIVQKVGSILEEENQRGLAHFLEHMCFNGTEHFPGNNLVDWCQSVGIKFGSNLNAYTSWDETVYQIMNVPTVRESVQDSCLLILHDWADALSLDGDEIEAERGVIHQEWRKDHRGERKLREDLFPVIMPGNKYAVRFPIGTIDVIDNFSHQALRDYYETWYRPDQQAIIVVGDINIDRIENKIKEMFGPIQMSTDAKPREYVQVEDTPGTIIAIGSDKEISKARFEMYFKQEPFLDEYKNTDQYQVVNYITSMITIMLNNRLSELSAALDCPFSGAGVYYGQMYMAKTKDALTLIGEAKNDIQATFKVVYRELLRAQRGGFTISEYERAKSMCFAAMETAYNNRDHVQNSEYIQQCLANFTNSEPLLDHETSWQMFQILCLQIPVEAINMTMAQMITSDNRVAMVFMPSKDGAEVPTEQQMLSLMNEVDAEDIEPYKEAIKDEPLIASLAPKGKIVKEKHNKTLDATEWTLSNGAKVILKQIENKEDEIVFEAMALGGTNSLDDKYLADIKFLPYALGRHGFGSYDNVELNKYLAGKVVSVEYDFAENRRNVRGKTTPKDMPAQMELIYSAFTGFGLSEKDFNATMSTYLNLIPAQESNSQYVFTKNVRKSLYDNSRKHMLTFDDVQTSSKENIVSIVSKMTSNASDFTFVFVGNVDIEAMRPLVETYIASLPSSRKARIRSVELPGMGVKPGIATDEYVMPMDNPQTWAYIDVTADMDFNLKNRLLANIAGMILSDRLIATVREEMGAVYSIGAEGTLNTFGKPNAHILTAFPMKPECKDEVLDYISLEIKNMETKISADEVRECIEYLVKNFNENMTDNNYILSAIYQWVMTGNDFIGPRLEVLCSITADDVKSFMKALNAQGNYRVVILDPAE